MDELGRQLERIRLLMDYAVPDTAREEAEDLLVMYEEDRVALDLLHEFYSFLPEGENDGVREIRLLARKQGIFLLAAITVRSAYIYLVSSEGIEFQGLLDDGLWDRELLAFFGFKSRAQCRRQCAHPEELSVYEPVGRDLDLCPACLAGVGEEHELGCPVEVCPWCGGQLIHCNCRFDQLGLDTIESEGELLRFEKLLEGRGRIPYSREQRPAFPGE